MNCRQPGSLLCVLVLSACIPNELPVPKFAMQTSDTCVGGTDTYFPPYKVNPYKTADMNVAFRLGMGRRFRSSGLAELWCGDASDGYRMAWAHSYRPAVVVEIRRGHLQWEAIATQFDDPREQIPARRVDIYNVAARYRRYLNTEEIEALHKDMTFLWNVMRDDINAMAEDGYGLVMEGRRANSYRVISRISEEEPAADAAARQMIRLSGMSVPFAMADRKERQAFSGSRLWVGVGDKTAWIHAGDFVGRHRTSPPRLIIRWRASQESFRSPFSGDVLEITAPLELRSGPRLDAGIVGSLGDTDAVKVLEVVTEQTTDLHRIWARVTPYVW